MHPALAAILTAAPQASGILYDLPEVLSDTSPIDVAGVRECCEVVGGDFFTSVPAGDILTLKTILHDWDDDACVTILRPLS